MIPQGIVAGLFGNEKRRPWDTPPIAGDPTETFQWGEGGARLSPEDIELRRKLAMQQQAGGMDFSPVGHWSQGLARVAQGLVGGLDMKRLDKASAANEQAGTAQIAALLGGGEQGAAPGGSSQAIIQAMMSQDPRVAGVGKTLFEQQNRPGPAPHYWETNDGSLGMVGPDGRPTVLYKDPTPKINWIQADNGDGTRQLIPVGPNGPMTGGAPGQGAAPPSTLPPDFNFDDEGGPAVPPSGAGFH